MSIVCFYALFLFIQSPKQIISLEFFLKWNHLLCCQKRKIIYVSDTSTFVALLKMFSIFHWHDYVSHCCQKLHGKSSDWRYQGLFTWPSFARCRNTVDGSDEVRVLWRKRERAIAPNCFVSYFKWKKKWFCFC